MFKQILATIIWLLASSWMQFLYQPSSMQELCQKPPYLQTSCHSVCGMQKVYQSQIGIDLAIARSLPNKTGTEIAIAWDIPKVIGTDIANAENIPN